MSAWVVTMGAGATMGSCMRRGPFHPKDGIGPKSIILVPKIAKYNSRDSKYNPIERCWGILENHWNGALLDSIEAVIRFATTMTWKGRCPSVELVTTTYQTGVKLTKDAMQMVETQLQRLPGLDKWFVDIVPTSSTIRAP